MFRNIIRTAGVLLLMGSCSKSYLDVNNNNPNQVTTVSPHLLLAGTLNTTASIVTTDFPFLGCYQGYWTIAQGFSDITDYANYNFSTNFGQNIWTDVYGNLGNLAQIEAAAKADTTLVLYGAMAKIIKALNFQILVDVYNNIPYFDASSPLNIYPKYDNADTVYQHLVLTIDTAIAMINGATPGAVQPTGSDDIMFSGNMTSWKQLGNTLKLRMLLHQAGLTAKAAYIQARLADIATEGDGFLAGNAWVNPGYSQNTNQQNPFFSSFGFNSTGGAASNYTSFKANIYTIAFFNNTNDVRIGYDYAPLTGYTGNPPYLYVGAPFGTIGLPSPSSASSIGAYMPATSSTQAGPRVGLLQSDAQSCPLLTATESLFLQAEAAERGWISSDPQTLYQQAITASYAYLLVNNPDSAAGAYYAQPIQNVGWSASTNKLEAIIVQKWAALNGIDLEEVWSDYRRTGFPSDLPPSNSPNAVSKTPPVRLLYPQIEYQTNAANVNAEGSINQFTSKIFWIP
ncbi:SusD/RagB family nutrient-binding outer membrane lipoprotein [Dinghuibacter silviterrae]|uniref:SusD-like starch-binding protein associating with outer membrane n=1 Tax=Dinghuibacter silviterrae TaxID=1539049 RepID=A0A4R8DMK8_9BACT|nr:SusD/RagB family nutrient-binding outer membrane lipoprotein [Dinghuibacter silviterrae]TDW99203.1 SusD-like starch-binding protein associating with outer membrane [Dinghuibacter silviterrae]